MNKYIYKIGLGLAVLLILCLFPLSYGMYQLIRYIAAIVFLCMAYNFYKEQKAPHWVIAAALAVLYQPLIKISLGRSLWAIVDVIVIFILLFIWVRYDEN